MRLPFSAVITMAAARSPPDAETTIMRPRPVKPGVLSVVFGQLLESYPGAAIKYGHS